MLYSYPDGRFDNDDQIYNIAGSPCDSGRSGGGDFDHDSGRGRNGADVDANRFSS